MIKSRIFKKSRVLGIVSNNVPLSMRYVKRRNENIVVTSVGKSFHTYGCSKLNLLSVSGEHPDDITCLTSDTFLVYTACKNIIYAWRRGNELEHTYKGPTKNVSLLLPFANYLIALYEDNTLLIWGIKEEDIFREMTFDNFSISAVVHPSAYLNKILLGSHEGSLQLWNLKKNALIFTFSGWGSAVTVLEQAPAMDVMAIGLASGEIYIHNLKVDETVIKFSQEWGAVTSISFRTDGPAIMASGSAMGHIAVWDLHNRRFHSEIRDAHQDSISGLEFLPNEPLLITNSADNSIKMWIFDLPDDGGHLLRLCEGHSRPPLKVQFYGTDGKNILSAGSDSTLRSFSTEVDSMNKSLGQASYNRKAAKKKGVRNDPGKMLPIIYFDSEVTREKDWDNIAAVHRYTRVVTTWSYDKCRMGEHKLLHERFKGVKKVEALCTNISACGNFVIIGYNTGHMDKFNIQSGICRGSFGEETAHDGSIWGIVSNVDKVVSGGADKHLKFWSFHNHSFRGSLELESSISKMIIDRASFLVAVAVDNFSAVLVNIKLMRIVRIFENFDGNITDLTFGNDPLLLIVATVNAVIKTWNVIEGSLIDWFTVPSICTSLSLAPSGEHLATTHTGSVGIFLWKLISDFSSEQICEVSDSYSSLTADHSLMTLEGGDSYNVPSEGIVAGANITKFNSPERISDEFVTISKLSKSNWLDLIDLDVIKLRNKPKEPVNVPKNAPFFLPVVSGLKPAFLVEETKDQKKNNSNSNILQVKEHKSEFFHLLESSAAAKNYTPVIEKLKSFSPSETDFEIQCLSPEYGGSTHLMECFLKTMLHIVKNNKDFELFQSYMAVFIKDHRELLTSESSLMAILGDMGLGENSWEKMERRLYVCTSLANYNVSAVL